MITAYMIPFGLLQLVYGPLADRYGKRRVNNYAMLCFTVTTALCAVAVNFTTLAVYRALTGLSAAAVMPVSLALIGDLVPMKERQAAVGQFMGISFLGQGLSMAIGGSIAFFLSWRGVFATYSLLSVVSTILLFTAGRRITCSTNRNSIFFGPYRQLLTSSVARRTYSVILLEGIMIVGTFSYLGAYISRAYHLNYLYIGLTLTAKFKMYARRILGVSMDAGTAQIRHAYWNLAKKYHPDLNGGDRSLEDQFKLISEAYEILTGEKNRGRYNVSKDEVLVPDGQPFADEESYWDWWKKRYGDII